MTDFPDFPAQRAPWLVTLADLALLLLGFMVLVQATATPHRPALAKGLREAFAAGPEPMPVAAAAARFPPGSATLADPAALVAWAREAAADPRVAITITGSTDGAPGDVDPASGSPALLAVDRARAVAAALGRAVPPARLRLATDPKPRGRVAVATLSFAGENP